MNAFETLQELDDYVESLRRANDEELISMLTEAAAGRALNLYRASHTSATDNEEKMHLISAEMLRRIRQHFSVVKDLSFQ